MKKVFDEVVWYCLGQKSGQHKKKHGYLKECKNVTAVQNLMGKMPNPRNNEFQSRYVELVESASQNRKRIK